MEQRTTFGSGLNAKTIMVRYMIVNSSSSYNVIIGRHSLNALNAVVSTPHLTMKYPMSDGRIGVVKADQTTARKCYEDSLRTK